MMMMDDDTKCTLKPGILTRNFPLKLHIAEFLIKTTHMLKDSSCKYVEDLKKKKKASSTLKYNHFSLYACSIII